MQSEAKTVGSYLTELPEQRRAALEEMRRVVLNALPEGYEESMQFGMIGYTVPLARYSTTYNGAPLLYAALAAQKNYMSLYLNCVYAEEGRAERFAEAFRATGKRLDMGRSCVRFRKVDDLPLDLIAQTIASTSVEEFIGLYEASRRKG